MSVIINGSNTPTAGAVAVGDGTTLAFTAAGTAGQYLQSTGSGTPIWVCGGGGGGGCVTQIIAGTNVTISPPCGTGTVTINATGGGGGACQATPTTLGTVFGYTSNTSITSLGYNAGLSCQANNTIAIGKCAARSGQGCKAVAIGKCAGYASQGSNAIAIGYSAGRIGQGANSIVLCADNGSTSSVGANALYINPIRNASGPQGLFYNPCSHEITWCAAGGGGGACAATPTTLGTVYGKTTTCCSTSLTALGYNAQLCISATGAVAIGSCAGKTGQLCNAVAVGSYSGSINQGSNATSVGRATGYLNQGANAVAIGYGSGAFNQGANAIAIGACAGVSSQPANSIVINASGTTINGCNANALYIAPIRNASNSKGLFYNPCTKEVTYCNAGGGGGSTAWSCITNITNGCGPTSVAIGNNSFTQPTYANLPSNLNVWMSTWDSYTSKFVMPGDPSSNIGSYDGTLWTNINSGISSGLYINSIATNGTVYVGVGYNNGTGESYVATSTNLTSWTTQSSGVFASGALFGVIWTGSQFVAVGRDLSSPPSKFVSLTSFDGVSWIKSASYGLGSGGSVNRAYILYNGSTYVTLVNDGSYIGMFTSTNGITWTQQNDTVYAGYVQGAAYDSTRGLFIAAGCDTGSPYTAYIWTSPDGLTWTPIQAGATGNGQFYSFGVDSSGNYVGGGVDNNPQNYSLILESTDGGANWTQRIPSTYPSSTIYTIAYSPTLNSFIATSQGLVLKSSGLSTWTQVAGYLPSNVISIGANAGASPSISGTVSPIAVGKCAGHSNQYGYAVAIGDNAGKINQHESAIAIGRNAGQTCQGSCTVAIGKCAGSTNQQSAGAVAIGQFAGKLNQTGFSIAIGSAAAECNQHYATVALGTYAGHTCQQCYGTALGGFAGLNNQGMFATALGFGAGYGSQGTRALAVGKGGASCNQGANAIAIGADAAQVCQGTNAIAIGSCAAKCHQPANTIVISALGTVFNPTPCVTNALYVAPVRLGGTSGSLPAGFSHMAYNPTTKEIIYWN